MQTRPIAVKKTMPSTALPNVDWTDVYEIEILREFSDMKAAALCAVGEMPRWAKPLLWPSYAL